MLHASQDKWDSVASSRRRLWLFHIVERLAHELEKIHARLHRTRAPGWHAENQVHEILAFVFFPWQLGRLLVDEACVRRRVSLALLWR